MILFDETFEGFSISYTLGSLVKDKEEFEMEQHTINLQEFKGLSKGDMKKLVNYFNKMKLNLEVSAEKIRLFCLTYVFFILY